MIDGYRFRVEELFRITNVIRRTNTRYAVWRIEQSVSDLAGHHVGFVRTSDRYQHIGIIGSRLAQYARVRAMPLDDTQVERILQAAQTVAIGINQRNIIVLADEVFRQRAADLAGAQNNNLHLQ